MKVSVTIPASEDRGTLVVLRRLFAFVMLVAISGCGEERIETVYGRSRGWPGEESVNGVRVLASMFKQAGHRVWTKRSLTDSMMEDCDVIVWAPDDFASKRRRTSALPSASACFKRSRIRARASPAERPSAAID